ncbi:MAG: hypothetical protein PHP64_02425 [Actinomycetota bacterium]|nr:hypothetical protein [Actinomycetota bacterium]
MAKNTEEFRETTMRGRRTKLTSEVQEKICKAIENGCTKESACAKVGITPQTLCNWTNWGREGREGYIEFFEAIKKAEEKAIAYYERQLKKCAEEGSITAIIFFLQNRAPERWKDKRAVEHSGRIENVDIEKEIEELTKIVKSSRQGQ